MPTTTTTRIHIEDSEAVNRLPYLRGNDGSDSNRGVWGSTDPVVNGGACVAAMRAQEAAGLPITLHMGWLTHRSIAVLPERLALAENVAYGMAAGVLPCGLEIAYWEPFVRPIRDSGYARRIDLNYANCERVPSTWQAANFPGVRARYEAIIGRAASDTEFNLAGKQMVLNTARVIVRAVGLDDSRLAVWGCAEFENGWGAQESVGTAVTNVGRPHFTATTPDAETTMRLCRFLRDVPSGAAKAVVHLTGDGSVPAGVNQERMRICRGMGCGDVIVFTSNQNAGVIQRLMSVMNLAGGN